MGTNLVENMLLYNRGNFQIYTISGTVDQIFNPRLSTVGET